MRLEYEGLHKSEAITTPGVRFYNDPAGYAMNRYAYYVCYKCKKVWQLPLSETACMLFYKKSLKEWNVYLICCVWKRKAGKEIALKKKKINVLTN